MAGINFILIIQDLQNDEERQNFRIYRRNLRDHSDPLTLPEEFFKSIYRLNRQTAHDLILELAPHLDDAEREEIGISKKIQILTALNFYAQGSYQKSCGQDCNIPISQSSVSRSIRKVSASIVAHMKYYIKFPRTDDEEAAEKAAFMQHPAGFPGIIGAIDCTQIAIFTPPILHPQAPAILFLNRKGFYSLNVQIICSANLKILAINARYPGSVHDSAIWSTSVIRRHLLNKYHAGGRTSWLLGDSGYPLEPWLMTPIPAPNDEAERGYNVAHKSVRNTVERFNGVFKGSFRCCSKYRVLHYDPVTSGNIINSCAILHNFRLMRGEHIDDVPPNNEDLDGDPNINNPNPNMHFYNEGRRIRNRIVRDYFI